MKQSLQARFYPVRHRASQEFLSDFGRFVFQFIKAKGAKLMKAVRASIRKDIATRIRYALLANSTIEVSAIKFHALAVLVKSVIPGH